MKMKRFFPFLFVLLVAMASGCGDDDDGTPSETKGSTNGSGKNGSNGSNGTDPVIIKSITISPASGDLMVGTELELTAVILDKSDKELDTMVTWTVTGPGTLSESSSKKTTLSATGAGSIEVTAKLGDVSSKATFDAKHPLKVKSITVEADTSGSLVIGQEITLTSMVLDSATSSAVDTAVNWTVTGPGTISEEVSKVTKLTVKGIGSIEVTAALGEVMYKVTLTIDSTLANLRVSLFDFEDAADIGKNSAGIAVTQNVTHSTQAKVGNGAAEFSGAQHFVLGKEGSISADSDYSLAYWFKIDSFTTESQNAFWTMSTFSGDLSDDPWKPGGLTFRFWDNRWSNYDVGWEGGASVENPVVADDQWHHLTTTVKHNDSTSGSDIKLYIDGTLVVDGTYNIKDPTWSDEVPELSSFVVKIGYSSTAGDAAKPFDGFIDDLQIFSSVLDDSKVLELYNENN